MNVSPLRQKMNQSQPPRSGGAQEKRRSGSMP